MRLLGLLSWAVALGFAGEYAIAPKKIGSAPLFFIEYTPGRYLIRVPGTAAVFTQEGIEFGAGGSTVRVPFPGANTKVALEGVDSMGPANFLLGQDPRQWWTGLPTHQKLRYRNLYRGIDLTYSGREGHLKSEFSVAPGAHPADIQVEYSADLSIDASGRLHAGSLSEGLTENAPAIYQNTPAGRV